MISTLMRYLSRVPLSHPRKVVLVSVMLTVLASLFIPRLHISTDRNLLAGTDSEEFQRREQVTEMFGTALVSVVVISADTGQQVREAADHLAADLLTYPDLIRDVFHRADVAFFERHALMFAPDDALSEIVSTLQSDGFRPDVLSSSETLAQLISAGAEQLSDATVPVGANESDMAAGFRFMEDVLSDVRIWFRDPSVTQPGIIDRLWKDSATFQGSAESDGYLTDHDGQVPALAVLFVQPASVSQSMEVVAPLTDRIRQRAQVTQQAFPGTKIRVSGMPSLQTDEMRLVTRDCIVAGLVSGLGVLLVFMIAFRSFRVSLFLVLPLGAGLLWAAGFTGAVYGHLTMITSYFAAVLFGLGVAFTIHIVSRFHEALLEGTEKRVAVAQALIGAGPGVLVGGITTAVAFLVIVFSEFKGFAEMGVISGIGILMILLANTTLLPAALLLWHPGKSAVVPVRRSPSPFERMARSRRVVPLVALALLVAGVWSTRYIRFNYAVESMLPQGSEAVEAIHLLNDRTDFSSSFSVAVADSPEAAAAKADRFRSLSTVSRVEAISDFVPAGQARKREILEQVPDEGRVQVHRIAQLLRSQRETRQRSTAAQLSEAFDALSETFADLAFDAGRAGRSEKAPLERLSKSAADTAATVAKGSDARAVELDQAVFGLLERGLGVLSDGLTSRGFDIADVPDAVRGRYVSADGQHFAVMIYPAGDIGERDFLYRHVDELLSVDPTVTGHVVTHRRFTDMVHRGFVQAVLLSALAVLLLVFLDLRTLRGVTMALLPVILSAGCTALVMALSGFMLNYANLMALPILIGTGVDYGVHLAHRTEQTGSVMIAVRTTGRAIALSGVTTLIGFGSLLCGNHWGVRSLGLLLVIGIFFALLASLVVLPGMMRKASDEECP